jgi:hypothetical protein
VRLEAAAILRVTGAFTRIVVEVTVEVTGGGVEVTVLVISWAKPPEITVVVIGGAVAVVVRVVAEMTGTVEVVVRVVAEVTVVVMGGIVEVVVVVMGAAVAVVVRVVSPLTVVVIGAAVAVVVRVAVVVVVVVEPVQLENDMVKVAQTSSDKNSRIYLFLMTSPSIVMNYSNISVDCFRKSFFHTLSPFQLQGIALVPCHRRYFNRRIPAFNPVPHTEGFRYNSSRE